MAGTFLGINTAVSSLLAQQQALDTLSHNIANANTPGYKRQRVVMAEGNPLSGTFASGYTAGAAIGTGVHVEQVQRVQDDFVDGRVRLASGQAAYWDAKQDTMSRVEAVFNEPSDQGIAGKLDQFWSAWDKLSAQPDDISARQDLILKAQDLTQQIRSSYSQLKGMKDDLGGTLVDKVTQVNSVISQIADLDSKIDWASSGQVAPNDLLDTRDALVTQLTSLAGVSVSGEGGGDFTVTLGNKILVQGKTAYQLRVREAPDGTREIYSAADGETRDIPGGEISALLGAYNNTIPHYMNSLDTFARDLIGWVNGIHSTGKTMDGSDAGDFFGQFDTAANIEVDPSILDSPGNIAASASGSPGDNSIALAIAALRYQPDGNNQTIADVYQAIVTQVGTQSALAKQNADTQDASLQQFVAQQQSISGVSLDEEMTDMVKYQQAYNAAARVFTACDDMLSTLINRTGLSGSG